MYHIQTEITSHPSLIKQIRSQTSNQTTGRNQDMPRKSSNPKTVLIATRVTPEIKNIIAQMSYREGLSVSEWLRNLIVVELKKNEALPMIQRPHEYSLELKQLEYEWSRIELFRILSHQTVLKNALSDEVLFDCLDESSRCKQQVKWFYEQSWDSS